MGATFDGVFGGFVAEAKKAFPADGTISEAEARYAEDPDRARREFAEDAAPAMHLAIQRNEELLDRVGSTRLFAGFGVPHDAPPANRAAVLDYVAQLISISCMDALVPASAVAQLGSVFENFQLGGQQDGDMDLRQLITSEEGQKLTADVAKVLGLDIDMTTPEAKQAMNMMQMMLF